MSKPDPRTGDPPPNQGTRDSVPDEVDAASGAKLVLVLTPFLIVIGLALLEWWIRSRAP